MSRILNNYIKEFKLELWTASMELIESHQKCGMESMIQGLGTTLVFYSVEKSSLVIRSNKNLESGVHQKHTWRCVGIEKEARNMRGASAPLFTF